jgi:hypothetical protein
MSNISKENLIALARREAVNAGLTPDLVPVFLGLVEQESSWNPRAIGPETRLYGKAKGLSQLIDATAKSLGVTDPFDPVQNLRGGARYFKQQMDRFGDVGLALAAYNWGPTNVKKMLDNPRGMRVPSETQNYVPKVLGNASRFGSDLAPTNATLAFFPGSGDVMKKSVETGVGLKLGQGGAADIGEQIKIGRSPSGRDLSAPPAAPAIAGDTMPGELPPGVGAPMAGDLPTMAQVTSTKAVQNVKSLDEYLKQQFGPMAAVADPFPKGYDQKLMNLIDQA